MHLAAEAIVDVISPTSSRKLAARNKAAASAAAVDDEDAEEGSDEDGNGSDEPGDGMSDAVGKALALIKQVSSFYAITYTLLTLLLLMQIRLSPQARTAFQRVCRDCDAPQLQLKLWVRTRWAGLSHALERLILLKDVSFR